uniref:Uncharacterized protein n=1 Tax=Rhabditophanes sp. KR3021 TaxID=114890 RepID=A0AC35U3L0_9BILA
MRGTYDDDMNGLLHAVQKATRVLRNIKNEDSFPHKPKRNLNNCYIHGDHKIDKSFSTNHPLSRRKKEVLYVSSIFPSAPYKYTQRLTQEMEDEAQNGYLMNKIVMNEVDYINKIGQNVQKS